MKNRLIALMLAAAAATAACASQTTESVQSPSPNLGSDFGTLNGATLDLTAEGGIAALQMHQIVRHDERTFVSTMRHLCGTTCGSPLDSTGGTLSPAQSDSLFNIAWSQRPYDLKDDYGTTHGAADMMEYTLRVQFEGRVKTIRADDGTMPDQMRAIVSAIHGIIAPPK